LAKYWVATPRAAPAAPASTALLPVKKRVLWAAGISKYADYTNFKDTLLSYLSSP